MNHIPTLEIDLHEISIVVPVYKGEMSLRELINEIEPLTRVNFTPEKRSYKVSEVVLVHDCGPDNSAKVIESLATEFSFIQPIWLTKNFGQHPATLAGMASSSGEWIITMDEDGQQNPNDIGEFLDNALNNNYQIVYGTPKNAPPHGILRNFFSSSAKKIAAFFLGSTLAGNGFSSFRLIQGEIGRVLAAYCGNGIYLDIALLWISNNVGFTKVQLRSELRPSNYTYSALFAHFWRMILTSGTKPLRMITVLGALSILLAIVFTAYGLYAKFIALIPTQGWTSLLIVISFFSGMIMISLGIIAEYISLGLGISMGKPLYVVATRPTAKKIK